MNIILLVHDTSKNKKTEIADLPFLVFFTCWEDVDVTGKGSSSISMSSVPKRSML